MNTEVVVYQAADGSIELPVRLEEDTVWLNQKQMAELFGRSVPGVNQHIKAIFREGELAPEAVIQDFLITASDGKSYTVEHYNLDVVISVGYRVKSIQGTRFRIWATKRCAAISSRAIRLTRNV